MLHSPLLIHPSADFWYHAASALLAPDRLLAQTLQRGSRDFSGLQVVVPAFSHALHWRRGLAQALVQSAPGSFIAPRIHTLAGWLALQATPPRTEDSQRIMLLYAQLREHGWLKKMFAARRNTDLLPLAQTLLSLADELTRALLPAMQATPGDADARWQAALEQLPPAARSLLSDEAQLVWSIWKSQLDGDDQHVREYARMLALARPVSHERPLAPLIWISPVAPEPMEQAFLEAYAVHAEVQTVLLDWRGAQLARLYQVAWPELCEQPDLPWPPAADDLFAPTMAAPTLALCPAASLEDVAVQSAQIVLDWLGQGKQEIAVVAQDRVSARRLRALLERAQVAVADETGWTLATTRAAAVLAAWCELVASGGATAALLDLIKSPFIFAGMSDKAALVMQIEAQLRRHNIVGQWRSILPACEALAQAFACVQAIAGQAAAFDGRRSLSGWRERIQQLLDALDMRSALQQDAAGQQVLAVLETLGGGLVAPSAGGAAGAHDDDLFSFAEWCCLLNLQLDALTFMPPVTDRRVLMLPLNGARLRHFDAVLVIGADAAHLPSQPQETLFFSNAVRHELGLPTRQSRQRQQLRDLAELLCAHREVVFSWQTHKDGEPNPLSPWLERLQLCLARAGLPPVRQLRRDLPVSKLIARPAAMPSPVAPDLLPTRLSASAYSSLVACPYQFFALRMLRVSVLDELSDTPEKRDYGGWLHQILLTYHETVRDHHTPLAERAALLERISEQVFAVALAQHPVALGYAARWQKVMPVYLCWANEREAQGWQFVAGEQPLQHRLLWPEGSIELHGRLDRLDQNSAGEQVVLDYKTRSLPVLVTRLKDAEDHQLPFYGLLSGQRLQGAHYVALEIAREQTGDVAAPDFARRQQDLQQQIMQLMTALQQGAGLPANGVASVCQYCEVRGLCRKGAW